MGPRAGAENLTPPPGFDPRTVQLYRLSYPREWEGSSLLCWPRETQSALNTQFGSYNSHYLLNKNITRKRTILLRN